MTEQTDITKYFNSAPVSSEFFDHLSDGNSKTSNVNPSPQPDPSNVEETVVCKLFSNPGSIKTNASTDPSRFFDMFSGNLAESSAGNRDSSDGILGQGIVNTSDILQSFTDYEENITKPRLNEADRSHDAWIVPEVTRRALISMVTSPPGTYVADRELLTMPGVVLEEDMKDTVYEVVMHYRGQDEASKRNVPTAAEVTQDDRGLRDLIKAGCYRAAVNLTKSLLTMYGQGSGRAGHPSKHTVHSIQLWFTRLALLVKLRCFPLATVEAEPFGDLDRPDMFFQFYPELYGGRLGSIVPFSFRLLIAQLPAYVSKQKDSLTKLHALLAIIRKMLSNLGKGLFEDGTPCELNTTDQQESVRLWRSRESRVLHAVVNCALSLKDYTVAIEVLEMLISREEDSKQMEALQGSLGRVLLQLGDIASAEKLFTTVASGGEAQCSHLVNSGLLLVAQNQFQEAYTVFEQAMKLDPTNITVVNNMAVCLLYLCRLKEAVLLLERALQTNPALALHESLLLNLCTLYEMQNSYCSESKLKLLSLVSQYKGDGVNLSCLKLQM